MKINLHNTKTMQTKQTKLGFSWTFFFFGWFVPLFRGDWKLFIITLIGTIVLGYVSMGFASAVLNIVFSFLYNKLYIQDLINKGFTPADEFSEKAIKGAGL